MALSVEEVRRLREERLDHPHPRVRRKMEVLLLKSQGLTQRQITAIEVLLSGPTSESPS